MIEATTSPPLGASVWERELWSHLTSHIESERGLLEEYSEVAGRTQSKALSYLVRILIEDEVRHHRMFRELADSLKTQAELGGGDPTIPTLDFDRVDCSEVVGIVDQLMDQEERDAGELKQLQRSLRDVKDTTLWGLVVDLMQRDTEKHLALLRFVRRHV